MINGNKKTKSSKKTSCLFVFWKWFKKKLVYFYFFFILWFSKKNFVDLTILFCLFVISTNNLFKTKKLKKYQLILQNSKRKIYCAKNNKSSSLLIKLKISCWKCAIVTKLFTILFFFIRWLFAMITNVKFTSFVTIKIKYNVKRVFKKQIT